MKRRTAGSAALIVACLMILLNAALTLAIAVPPLVIAYQKTADHNGYKYRYIVTPTHTAVHWVDFYRAEQECVKWGGHLASVHSQQELNFIKGLVTRNALTYIGHDVNKWTDGTPNDFTAWKTQLRPRLTYKYGSSNLKQPAFICRKKLPLVIAYEKTVDHNGYKYRYVVTPTHTSLHWMDFYRAEKECVKWGGHLASIHSQQELNFIKGLVTRGALTYIGHDVNKWTDGTSNDFTAWKTQLRPRLTYKFGSSNLKQPAFICKKKLPVKPLVIAYEKTVDHNGYKYRYVVTPTHTSVHWVEFYRAEQECVKWGGHLASIHSQQELNFIKGLVTRGALTYIGHDVNKWTDGTPNDFTAWKTQLRPRLTYKFGSSNLKQPAFICKKKLPGIVIAYEKTVDHNCHKYRYVVTPTHTPVHWVDFYKAEKECVKWGGHLTSIHSQQELHFIKTLVTRNALTYIGHDVSKWTDGTPNDFTAWKTQLRPRLTYKFGSSNLKQPAFICKKKSCNNEFEITRQFNGKTYRYVVTSTTDPSRWVKFYTAENDCQKWGGHLTSIHTGQELNFIKSLITRKALTFVGFDVTRWTDTSTIDYSCWKSEKLLTYRRGSLDVKQPAYICRK